MKLACINLYMFMCMYLYIQELHDSVFNFYPILITYKSEVNYAKFVH